MSLHGIPKKNGIEDSYAKGVNDNLHILTDEYMSENNYFTLNEDNFQDGNQKINQNHKSENMVANQDNSKHEEETDTGTKDDYNEDNGFKFDMNTMVNIQGFIIREGVQKIASYDILSCELTKIYTFFISICLVVTILLHRCYLFDSFF